MTLPKPRSALPSNPHHGLGASAHDVLDSLRRLGPTSATALAEDTGRTLWLVGSQLWRLHGRGLVEHDGVKPPRRRTWRTL